MEKMPKNNDIISRNDFRFIICDFGADKIGSDNRIRKYFNVLDNFVPYANVVLGVSEYMKSILSSFSIKIYQ